MKRNHEQEFYRGCFGVVKEASLRVLKRFAKITTLGLEEFKNGQDMSHDHWVCSVAILLGPAKVYVKVHFDSKTARKLAASGTAISRDRLPISILTNYMEEYLNLLMGDVKNLYKSEEELVSIPRITPTYDQGTGAGEEIDLNNDYWRIDWPEGNLVFGCFIVALGDVSDLKPDNATATSSVVFL